MKQYDSARPQILFEDNHLLFVDKPAGLLTQPSGTDEDSLESHVKAYLKNKYHKPGNVYLHAVHRLDKSASGIVLFAKTSKALGRMNELIRERKVKKQYLAIVEGHFESKSGTLRHFLVHDAHKAIVDADEGANGGKESVLHYEVVDVRDNRSLVRIDLETGRYHQIRAQLAAVHHPIQGDTKYGSRLAFQDGAIALQHYAIEFVHPVTQEQIICRVRVLLAL